MSTLRVALCTTLLAAACATDASGSSVAGPISADDSTPPGALGDPDVIRIDAAAIAALLGATHVFVDLRDPDRVVLVDHRRGPVELARVWIVCPNGASMGMRSWLASQDEAVRAMFDADLVALSSVEERAEEETEDERAAADRAAIDDGHCRRCPDGVWLCDTTWQPLDDPLFDADRSIEEADEPGTPGGDGPSDPDPPSSEPGGSGSSGSPGTPPSDPPR